MASNYTSNKHILRGLAKYQGVINKQQIRNLTPSSLFLLILKLDKKNFHPLPSFKMELNAIWRKVISSKFGKTLGGWHTCDIKGAFGVGLWKEIIKEWPFFLQEAAFSIGDGRRVNFWKDVWCGEEALSSMFPSLFNMAIHKDAMEEDMWDCNKEEGG